MSQAKRPSQIKARKKILGLSFKKPLLLESALCHPSYRHETRTHALQDFERLEFYGDSILNFIICRKLYKIFPHANEGTLSRLRSILVSRKILSRIAKEWGLIRYVKLGKSLRKQKKIMETKILSDSFEALLAALYFDQGLTRTERFILERFDGYFDSKRLLRLDPNPKSTLQELSQKQWHKLPVYSHQPTKLGMKTTVRINRRKATAVAKTRRESEEKAAWLLVRQIRQELLKRSKKSSSGKKVLKPF